MRLDGRVALITGAARGIGKAVALTMADRGADIILNDVTVDSLKDVMDAIKSKGRRAWAFAANVADREAVRDMVARACQATSRIDILVNNAGITRDAVLLKMTEAQWDEVIAVNLKGVFNCSQAVAEVMVNNNYGRIITISSIAGQMGNIGQANYSATKAGVIGLTKTLAKELARYSITANAIAPGVIDTEMIQTIPDKVKEFFLKQIPAGRFGRPEEIGFLAAFLASDEAAYITGQVIACNGGWYM